MPDINRFALMLEAYSELKSEMDTARQTSLTPALPCLNDVLAEFGDLPDEALFLGVASDGLPVLLNLHDSLPGPLLVIGDSASGKTTLLKNIAHAAERLHQPDELQFGTVTSRPEEWSGLDVIRNNIGTFSVHSKSSDDFILSLASWAHGNKTSRQSILLFMDDLEMISKMDFDTVQNFRWLLFRGPSRRIWPIITISTDKITNVESWLGIFRTRILGNIQDTLLVRKLNAEQADLSTMLGGSEFTMRENDHWLRFWIPTIDG